MPRRCNVLNVVEVGLTDMEQDRFALVLHVCLQHWHHRRTPNKFDPQESCKQAV